MKIEIIKAYKCMHPKDVVSVDEAYGLKLIKSGVAKEVKDEKAK